VSTAATEPTETERLPFEQVQILGPFHSGTCLVFNYLQTLFHARVAYHTLCWKHSLPPEFRRMERGNVRESFAPPEEALDRTLFVCMVRLPYFWLSSMLREPHHVALTASRDADEGTRLRSGLRLLGRSLPNLPSLWNAYYRGYLEHLAPRAALEWVRLEDLVQRPEEVLTRLGGRLRRREEVDVREAIDEISSRPAKIHGGRPCVHGEAARREYVPERVPLRFTGYDLAFVNGQLDPALMRRFDYPFVA
jgi:hypothetical protein